MTYSEMINVLWHGRNIYNTKTGLLLIPDVVDGDRYDESSGFRLPDNDWLYGYNICQLDPARYDEYIEDSGSVVEYALGHIPAAGTCAPNRMDYWEAYDEDDLNDLADELLAEAEGWKEV